MSQLENPKDWSADLRRVQELCALPGMNVARLFRIVESEWAHGYATHGKEAANQQLVDRMGVWRLRNGAGVFRAATICNRYVLIPTHVNNEVIVPVVADLIDPDTDAVVELGCGFGRHLFALRDLLEHKFPNLKYFGGELSDSGLAAANRIAGLEPGRAFLAFHKFNYLKPTLDFLSGCKKVVFFTCHSIEQVRHIGQDVFQAMLAAAPSVRGVHGEPVGWQLNTDVRRDIALGDFARVSAERAAFKMFNTVDDYRSAIIVQRCGWNEDLIPQLLWLRREGGIEIDRMDLNCAGNDTYNPTTMIAWRKSGS